MKTGYEEQLQNPDKGARGKTRWWWYGCRVNREHDGWEGKGAGLPDQ